MLTKLKQLFMRKFFASKTEPESLQDTIEEIIKEGETSLNLEEKDLITDIIKLMDVTADDIKIPRAEITGIPIDSPFQDLLRKFKETGFVRLPVYSNNLDNILGYIHLNDLLSCAPDFTKVDYAQLMREVLFVTPSMPLLDLLMQMRTTHIPVAVVVDEFGGVDGLVTDWNIVHEIIGELEDAYGADLKYKMTKLSDGSVLVNARMEIEEFEEEFGPILTAQERKEEDIETVGGLVIALAGRVPIRKEIINHPGGVEFEVLDADPRKVKHLRVSKKNGLKSPEKS